MNCTEAVPKGAISPERYVKAQAFWRDLCSGQHDAEDAYGCYVERYPDITPERFRDEQNPDRDERQRYQKAKDLLWGKARNGLRSGGEVGRLRVLANEPLRHTVIHFRQIKKLAPLEYDIFTQFAREQMEYVKSVLAAILPALCWFVIEVGRYQGLHVHVLHPQSSPCFGATLAPIGDHELLKRLMYLTKEPLFNFASALGYLTVRQAYGGGSVASRHNGFGVDARRVNVSLAQIEEAIGTCPGTKQDEDLTRIWSNPLITTSDTYLY